MATNVAPSTDRAVAVATTANDLFNAAENNPIAKADLQTLFDSISHGGAISPGLLAYLVTTIGAALQAQGVTVDNQLLALLIGIVATGASYLWQWVSIKLRKPPTKS
jgi:hypothetical protein